MDCRQSQALMALAVGQDHPAPDAESALHQHLEHCPGCRQVRRQLLKSQQALLESRLQPDPRRRLWPRIAELAELEQRPQFARFNVLVPSAVAAAACLLLVSVTLLEVSHRPPTRDLFVSDPAFNAQHGKLPTDEDLERWRRRRTEGFSQELPVLAPPVHHNQNRWPPPPF